MSHLSPASTELENGKLIFPFVIYVIVCFYRDSRVVRDAQTLKSKGYGFVSFIKKSVSRNTFLFFKGWDRFCFDYHFPFFCIFYFENCVIIFRFFELKVDLMFITFCFLFYSISVSNSRRKEREMINKKCLYRG